MPEATQPASSVEIPSAVKEAGAVYGPHKNVSSVVPEVRKVKGTPTHDPPETVESIFVCDKRLAFPLARVSSARSCPIPAVMAREPPPLRHTATSPVAPEINEATARGGI